MKINNSIFFALVLLLISSCATKKITPTASQNIANQINNSLINQQHQVGFIIKEIGASQNILEQNANHYFTPASNTKLFTFYTALNMLGDSIPAFEYVISKDSLIIWPMADATFLHPDFKEQKAFDFLKNSGKNIYLVNGRYAGEKFGTGWSWDDFNDYYQSEITEFPLYGNSVNVSANSDGGLNYSPDLPAMYLSEINATSQVKIVKRNLENNNLTIPTVFAANFKQSIPLVLNKNIVEDLLTDTLLATGLVTKPVRHLPWREVSAKAKVFYSTKADSLYKHMLQPSDNFMAEEMLLNCAAANHLNMSTSKLIEIATEKYLINLPDKIQWVDGSGLSRLNLFTPRDMVALLQNIYDKVNNEDRLFSLLANGGKSGTLRNMFKSSPTPFVYAKSGSLSNNYNLSGYLIGKSGKKYIFSYMNNNYVHSTSEIRAEVDRVLTFIHDNN